MGPWTKHTQPEAKSQAHSSPISPGDAPAGAPQPQRPTVKQGNPPGVLHALAVLLLLFLFLVISTPDVGLELTALRSRVARFPEPARCPYSPFLGETRVR